MNEIVNKFLLAGDKLMPEIHLIQPEFTYWSYETFTKNKGTLTKIKKTGYSQYIYQKKLDKAHY